MWKKESNSEKLFCASQTKAVQAVSGRMPDSAVAIDGKREARSFRNEVDGFVPLSRDRSAVLRRAAELHRNDLMKAKMILNLQSRTSSLLQDCTSLPSGFPLTAESGLIQESAPRQGFGASFESP